MKEVWLKNVSHIINDLAQDVGHKEQDLIHKQTVGMLTTLCSVRHC